MAYSSEDLLTHGILKWEFINSWHTYHSSENLLTHGILKWEFIENLQEKYFPFAKWDQVWIINNTLVFF